MSLTMLAHWFNWYQNKLIAGYLTDSFPNRFQYNKMIFKIADYMKSHDSYWDRFRICDY